jgi:hypothetical protein
MGIMASEVKSATEATEIAMDFVKKHRWFARPVKATRDNGIWRVEIDVGPILVAVAKVKIDATSGAILEYDIP